MNEIANCPRCGKPPRKQDSDPGYYNLKTYYCCGHAVYADDEKPWNQYASAMELARAEVSASNVVWSVPLERLEPAINASEDMLFQAKMRVLEVFGGK